MNIGNLNIPETTPHTPIKVYCDASHHPDSIASVAWVFTDHNGALLDTSGCNLGNGYTSVQAENAAVKRVLRALNSYNQAQHVKVYTDCKPVVHQLENVNLAKGNYESVTLEWIPREENQIADQLADLWVYQKSGHEFEPSPTYGMTD
jgi:ribonuclease HI